MEKRTVSLITNIKEGRLLTSSDNASITSPVKGAVVFRLAALSLVALSSAYYSRCPMTVNPPPQPDEKLFESRAQIYDANLQ